MRVLQASQVTGSGERQQERRDPDQADTEVGEGVRADRALGAHHSHERLGEEEACEREDNADPRRQPHPLNALLRRPADVPRTEQPCDGARRSVREEYEERVRCDEQRAGNGETTELWGPEVADHGGIDEDVERLCDQSAERGQREAQDLAVVRVALH